MGHGKRGQERWSGPSGTCLDLDSLSPFFTQMPKATEKDSKRNAPNASSNKSGAAKHLPGYERCWCRGFNDGCGLVRSSETRRIHAIKEGKIKEGQCDEITHHIHTQSLTLKFLKNKTHCLVNFPRKSVHEVNGEDHQNIPREPQDERMPLDNVDLEAGKDQPTTGLQEDSTFSFDLHIDQSYSPSLEPGLSQAPWLQLHQVFNIGPGTEPEEEEEGEENPELKEDTYVWFQLDVESESEVNEVNEIHGIQLEDLRIVHGEEAHQLDIKWELQELGSGVLMSVERDNIKAMALKIGNQLTRKAYKGVQKLTQGRMEIASEYVAGRILECVSKLSVQIYDCCVNSCICFTGEFEPLTTCPLCGEPRHDERKKARNRFRYIPIMPRLQSMFQDRHTIQMLLYRLQREVGPDRIEDVWDSKILQELLDRNVVIDGHVQEYCYGELDTDVFLAFTCDGISIHKGIGAQRSQTEYTCFPLELIILNLPPEVRTRDEYVYSLGVIPGPREPKHLDSFCWPFYLECTQGLKGIQTYHATHHNFFPLRFYCPLAFGDLKAMIKLKGTVGVGALRPCHQCNVDAIRDTSSIGQRSKTYYIPLTIPGEMEPRLADILSNLRTHADFEETYHCLDIAGNETEKKRIRRETGISRGSLFSLLPYFDMARSVPHGFMHMVYINQFKALINLWCGKFKGLDSGTGHYIIPGRIWKTISIETWQAVKPSQQYSSSLFPT